MSIISIILVIIVAGVLLWLAETYVPMAEPMKKLLRAVVVIVIVLWLLQVFGLFGHIGSARIR